MRLLDLFCCAGGAGAGYAAAGFEVVGVDIDPQPRYPFEFVQGDALEYVAEHGHKFDVIHASPPCQAFSRTKTLHTNEHPDLIEPTRAALRATGKPYVIENVVGAPLLDPIKLDGRHFAMTAPDSASTIRVESRPHRPRNDDGERAYSDRIGLRSRWWMDTAPPRQPCTTWRVYPAYRRSSGTDRH